MSDLRTVVTYQSPAGHMIKICGECEMRLRGDWPKDVDGGEYCAVSRGGHHDVCDVHPSPKPNGERPLLLCKAIAAVEADDRLDVAVRRSLRSQRIAVEVALRDGNEAEIAAVTAEARRVVAIYGVSA